MKDRYSDELPFWMKWIGIWRINRDSIDFKWGYFAPRFGLEFIINRGGYFDQRYVISFCIIWGVLHIKLPFKTRIPESCDTPRYGIQIHGDTFWLHLGGKMNDHEQCDSKWITWGCHILTGNSIGIKFGTVKHGFLIIQTHIHRHTKTGDCMKHTSINTS